jgi:hypothetical protein
MKALTKWITATASAIGAALSYATRNGHEVAAADRNGYPDL